MYKSKDLKDNLLAGSMSAVNKAEFVDEISSAAVKATGTLTYTGIADVSEDEVFVIGSTTVTVEAAAATANSIVSVADLSLADAALSVKQFINNELPSVSGVSFNDRTFTEAVVATVNAGVVTITARAGGVAANAIATTTDQANATMSAATLTGGVDPAFLGIETTDDAVQATVTLTLDTKPTEDDYIVIGSRTYTWKDTIADADDVFIGASLATSKANLVSAIALDGTEGTTYGTGTLPNTEVTMAAFAADDAVVTAVLAGSAGSSIASTESHTAGGNVFDTATLVGGLDSPVTAPSFSTPTTYANDTAAAADGVPIGGIYRVTTTGVVQWRTA